MINLYVASFVKLVLGLLLGISQLAEKPDSAHASILSPGDQVNGMTLSKGADDAHSLWAFCFNSPEGEGSYILDCRAPALAPLRIANSSLYANEAIPNVDWSDLIWGLSIDGQAVDLEPFETFDYVLPSLSKILAAPVLETFQRGAGWDIVLTDLQPGHHTLWMVAESKKGSYTWFVNLDIESVEKTNMGSIPFPPHS